jgi:superfamily I DNA/RNA helicase
MCPPPRQILAISFKRDAARNLMERVKQRCGSELASRFHSYTFDAFAKGLVDRFWRALPEQFRPCSNFTINFQIGANTLGEFIRNELPTRNTTLSEADRRGINGQQLYRQHFIGRRLEIGTWQRKPILDRAAAEVWEYMLHGSSPPQLTFPMIGRLAELLLRTNPLIIRSLRAAYRFVFLDEFQDTSSVHYDLTCTAFRGSRALITAVGDNKQRVNKWAGAMDGIFEQLEADFSAERLPLLMNYRSAPELVRIQAVFAAAIDHRTPPAIPKETDDGAPGECLALEFRSYQHEALGLADRIQYWMELDRLSPRDVCVLCRQRPASYAKHLQEELANRHIPSRVENELQDLVAEEITTLLIDILCLAASARVPACRVAVLDVLYQVRGQMSDGAERKEISQLDQFLQSLRGRVNSFPRKAEAIRAELNRIVDFFGAAELKAAYPQYGQGAFFSTIIDTIAHELSTRLQTMPLADALDDFIGINTIPIMTMHKSKGLEYHTVVFVGLEDSALFGYSREPTEEMCGFFVALSRAMQRVVFTFSAVRPNRYDRIAAQSRREIHRLYDLLAEAGIQVQIVS